MADQSDVEIALVSAVSVALYPAEQTRPVYPAQTAAYIAAGRILPRWIRIWRPARSISQYFPAAALVAPPPRYAEQWVGTPAETDADRDDRRHLGHFRRQCRCRSGRRHTGRRHELRLSHTGRRYAAISGRQSGSHGARQFDRPSVARHADDCRCRKPSGPRGGRRISATGSSSAGTGISHHLLVSDVRRGAISAAAAIDQALSGLRFLSPGRMASAAE